MKTMLPAMFALMAMTLLSTAAQADTPVGDSYQVQVREGEDAQWRDGGVWVFGGRADERPIELRLHSGNAGQDVVGQVKYRQKEGMLGLKLHRVEGRLYASATKRGNDDHVEEGHWSIGTGDQTVRQLIADSTDGGETLTGKVTYAGGEPLDFMATVAPANTAVRYHVEVRPQVRGGEEPGEWEDRGTWEMGSPTGERPSLLHLISRGEGVGGLVRYTGDQSNHAIFLDHIEGRRFGADKMMAANDQVTDHGEWVLDDKHIRQVWAQSQDAGQTLTGTISYRGGGVQNDFRATLLDAEPEADAETAAGGATWDGKYAHEDHHIQIAGDRITLLVEGSDPLQGEITTATAETFEGHFNNGEHPLKITGGRDGDTLNLTVGESEPLVYHRVTTPTTSAEQPVDGDKP